jgi:NAD(P)H-dependent FMN reductase
MNHKTLLTCAVTGNLTTPEQTPHLPITPAQLADESLAAAEAGAAAVHIHVRDPATGRPSMDVELYRDVVDRIRSRNRDVIINLTTGPGGRFVPGEPDPPAPVSRLRAEVAAADALVFCTPEYAGSLPGTLKNLLDWLVAGGELGRKPATWLSVSPPGQDDGARDALETALGHGNAKVLKACCVRVPVGLSAIDDQGLISDPQLNMALLDMLHSVARVLSFPEPKDRPSWHTYSSVLPVIQRRGYGPRG